MASAYEKCTQFFASSDDYCPFLATDDFPLMAMPSVDYQPIYTFQSANFGASILLAWIPLTWLWPSWDL